MHENPALAPLVPIAATSRAVRIGRLRLELRQYLPAWQQVGILVGAIFLGLAFSTIILISAGVEPAELAQEFIADNLFVAQNLRAVLEQTAPFIMVGLAAAVAFRIRFWNLGIEGQMIWGGMGATLVPFYHLGPDVLHLPLMALCAVAGGMAWIGIAVFLKLRLKVNEIITTLLLNYVAMYFMFHLIYGAWLDPKDSFPHSPTFAASERLPDIVFGINWALPLALIVTGIVWWVGHLSRASIFLKFVQANDRMALAVGIPITTVVVGTTLLSGALAGTGGFIAAAALEGRLTQGFFHGYGFSGILIAFLARNHPLGVVVVAFLVALLFDTGRSLEVFDQLPMAMVQLVQGVIVITVAASEFFIRHRIRWIR